MKYTMTDVVNHFHSQDIKIRPKKIRRIARNLYPGKESHKWTLTEEQFKDCIEVVNHKLREIELGGETNEK